MHPDWQTEIMRYCEAHSSPEPIHLQEVVRFTWLNTVNPRQLSGHLQGRFLSMLSFLMKPECILEVGTFTGYSALSLAEGLTANGLLHSIEANEELVYKSQEQINASPYAAQIKVHLGNGLELIPLLNLKPNIIFIDAAKHQYIEYCKICLPLLQTNGVMLFDNTLWSGKVIDNECVEHDSDTNAMDHFNNYTRNLPNVDVLMLPLRDGITVLRVR
jgi:caffeoyl-CoA O-methyltransferase